MHWTAPEDPDSGGKGDLVWFFGGLFFIITIAGPIGGALLREPTSAVACQLTGCSAIGSAALGWLLVVVPTVAMAVLWWGWTRWTTVWRRVGMTVTAVLVVLGVQWIFPGRDLDLEDMLDGLAEHAFGTGLRWGGLSFLAILVALAVGAIIGQGLKRPIGKWIAVIGGGTASLVLLGVGLSRAWMPPLTAAEMFAGTPARSLADQDGCTGVVANDPLLDGCMRTVRAVFKDANSDAEVALAAVLFPTPQRALNARTWVPNGSGQTGYTGDVLTSIAVIENWLVFTTARNDDGLQITNADRVRMQTMLAQTEKRFAERQRFQ